jgi:putative MATE family efflux protein
MQYISSVSIGIIDQAMVGRISITAFGAVGLISSTIYSITGMLGILALAFNIIGSQCKGANKDKEFNEYFNTSIIFCMIIGSIFYLITFVFKIPILVGLFGIKNELLVESAKYLNIYSLSVGLTMMLFVFSALFKIEKKTKWVFYASLAGNVVNLALDYILIFGKLGIPKLGVTGAALGSVIALIVEIGIYIIVFKDRKIFKFRNINFRVNLKKLVKDTIPLAGQEFLESTLIVISFNAILARIGVLELSTYTLINNIINITLIPMHAYASTCLTLVGESNGKNDTVRLDVIPKLSILLTVCFWIVSFGVCTLFRNEIPKIITNDIFLLRNAAAFIPFVVFIQLFNNGFTIYKCSLQGLNLGYWVFFTSCLVNIASAILIVMLVFIFKVGLLGLYIGLGCSYLVLFIASYRKYYNYLGTKIIIPMSQS